MFPSGNSAETGVYCTLALVRSHQDGSQYDTTQREEKTPGVNLSALIKEENLTSPGKQQNTRVQILQVCSLNEQRLGSRLPGGGGREAGSKQTNSPEWAARCSKRSLQRPEAPSKMKIKAYSRRRFTLSLQALYREKL